jgi:hypothetical protein
VHLRTTGQEDAWFGSEGLDTWRDAGFLVREPAWKSPLPVRHWVRVSAAALQMAGLPGVSAEGTVQDVVWAGIEFRYDVLIDADGRFERVSDLAEEDLQSAGPRGAAGFGDTL